MLDDAVGGFIESAEFLEKFPKTTGATAEPTPDRETELYRQLGGVLGDTAVARLKDYQETGSERLILAQYRHELRMADIALPQATANSLFQIICEERAKTPALPFDPRGPGANADMRRALEGDNAERYYKAEADLNMRVLSRAGAVLSPEQYEALDKFQQRHLAAEEAGIEAIRRTAQQEQAADSPED